MKKARGSPQAIVSPLHVTRKQQPAANRLLARSVVRVR
jgi:hypothetical protein